MTQAELDGIRETVFAALRRRLRDHALPTNISSDNANLVDLGLIDSLELLDVLLEVEAACGREFDPERLDFEGGLTIRKLVAAFAEV